MSKGFTLVELILTMALLLVMATMVVTNMRSGESTRQLRYAAQELVSQLERMRNFSQTGVVFNNQVPAGGYGVAFDFGQINHNSYTLFADINANGIKEAGEQMGSVYTSPHQAYFSGLVGVASPGQIVFTPPYGDIKINNTVLNGDITLTLKLPNKPEVQKVIFNIQNHTIDY